MVFPCRIQDISAGGVSILAPTPPVSGMELILHVPYLGEYLAEPVHVVGERVGLRFLIGADAQSSLVDQLTVLLRSDRRAESGEVGVAIALEDEDVPQAASA